MQDLDIFLKGVLNNMPDQILKNISMEKDLLKQSREKYHNYSKPGVSVIVPTFKRRYITNILENYLRSSYPVKELIIILNNNELDPKEYLSLAFGLENVKVLQLDEKFTLGRCLNFGVNNSKYDYISRMDDDDYYGPNYLTGLMNVFNYTDAQMTGKNPVFVYFENNSSLYLLNHDNPVMGGTFVFKKEIFEKVRFRDMNFREDYYFLLDCISSGIKIHASDKFNYVYVRHSNLEDHTFRLPSDIFIRTYDVKKILTIKDFTQFVTV